MSLIPLENSITGAMPVIFFEAQIHGQSQKILMEIGLSLDTDQCSVALLSDCTSNALIYYEQYGKNLQTKKT
ncbi:unnamed protein product [Dracunculus medinensis]|uniref:Sen15 domain-containing protein n=1 Tax=Dracunculus medinensis TaxID=318479 RepID=A0A0N4U1B0_DRAME|nr:unnamed protein product [Dracunculus medinensis]